MRKFAQQQQRPRAHRQHRRGTAISRRGQAVRKQWNFTRVILNLLQHRAIASNATTRWCNAVVPELNNCAVFPLQSSYCCDHIENSHIMCVYTMNYLVTYELLNTFLLERQRYKSYTGNAC